MIEEASRNVGQTNEKGFALTLNIPLYCSHASFVTLRLRTNRSTFALPDGVLQSLEQLINLLFIFQVLFQHFPMGSVLVSSLINFANITVLSQR